MTKYIARVTEVFRSGIHVMAKVQNGAVIPLAGLPLPDRVEIELEGGRENPCMMYRYTEANQSCGDTRHENLEAAFEQAKFEYGLDEKDFSLAERAV